ncbi:hypothetical protein INR49_007231, partial [Caranx melampygus]
MRERRDNAELVRNIGFGVTLIPIAGWIAGPIMVVGGQIEMDQASAAVGKARRESDITAADIKIHATEARLRYMSVRREAVADIQDKLRRAVTQLGLLSGVGSVAELQTRRLILLEPVMKVLEEMTTVLGQIGGNELLYN